MSNLIRASLCVASHAKPKVILLPCWQIHVYNISVHISLTDSCVSVQYSKLRNSSDTYIV